jgi:hypothetical protein
VSTFLGNSNASLGVKDLTTFNGDSLKNKIFSDQAGPASGMVSVAAIGPSLMLNLNKKSSIALTSRVRAQVNIIDFDGKLAQQLIDDAQSNITYPYTIASSGNMLMNVNGWSEFGLSYARIISDQGPHFLKGGVTLKYLGGAANAYVNVGRLNATVNENLLGDPFLTATTGTLGLGFGGVNLSNFDAADLLKFKSSGFGTDLGFVYEYRPDSNNLSRSRNKYQFKLGVALLDIGSINYTRDVNRSGAYTVGIPNGQRFFLSSLANASIDDYKDTLNNYPQYFQSIATGNGTTYKVSLPSTLQVDLDYHLYKSFYLGANAQVQLTKTESGNYNSQYYNAFMLIPRYEGRAFGVYLPLSYNTLTDFSAGLSLRAGPFFIGSGSLLTALFGSSKQADFHFGIRFGSLHKKEGKKKKQPTDQTDESKVEKSK